MGMSRFMPIISLKGSETYLFSYQCLWDFDAIHSSGARNPAARRGAWVRLVVALTAGVPLHHNPAFLNPVFPV
jgi:hypothetical protein